MPSMSWPQAWDAGQQELCGGLGRVQRGDQAQKAGAWTGGVVQSEPQSPGRCCVESAHLHGALIIAPPVRRLGEGCRRGALAFLAFRQTVCFCHGLFR